MNRALFQWSGGDANQLFLFSWPYDARQPNTLLEKTMRAGTESEQLHLIGTTPNGACHRTVEGGESLLTPCASQRGHGDRGGGLPRLFCNFLLGPVHRSCSPGLGTRKVSRQSVANFQLHPRKTIKTKEQYSSKTLNL